MTVKPNAELRRPRFIKQLSDTSVSEEGSLMLNAEFSSMESVKQVDWLLNGQSIDTTTVRTVKITTSEKKSTLSVEKIEKTFSGAVSCVVSNEFGQVTSTCGVSVRPKPGEKPKISIKGDVEKANVPEGEDFLWTCAVQAPEPFNVTWSKVGEVCDQEALSRIKLETTGSDNVLFHITSVHTTDAGTYRCTLTYEEQTTYCEVTLGVTESNIPPEIPEPPVIDKVSRNSVGLKWPKVVMKEKKITYTIEQVIVSFFI